MANPRRISSASAAEQADQGARAERAVESVATAAAKGAHAWLGSQADLWREIDAAGRSFMQRRREAIEGAQRSLEEMQNCRDIVDALKIQQHFVSGALQQAAAEMGELSVLALTVSQRAMGGMLKSGRTMAAGDSRNAEDFALSVAGSKPGPQKGGRRRA
jgi:hypothetical protein